MGHKREALQCWQALPITLRATPGQARRDAQLARLRATKLLSPLPSAPLRATATPCPLLHL